LLLSLVAAVPCQSQDAERHEPLTFLFFVVRFSFSVPVKREYLRLRSLLLSSFVVENRPDCFDAPHVNGQQIERQSVGADVECKQEVINWGIHPA
jgi:hypothetical protein